MTAMVNELLRFAVECYVNGNVSGFTAYRNAIKTVDKDGDAGKILDALAGEERVLHLIVLHDTKVGRKVVDMHVRNKWELGRFMSLIRNFMADAKFTIVAQVGDNPRYWFADETFLRLIGSATELVGGEE